ncbi:uncharacterized protein C20orf96 homolog isoform X1 [Prionailurus iriomotensis]
MAHVFPKPNRSGIRSTVHNFQILFLAPHSLDVLSKFWLADKKVIASISEALTTCFTNIPWTARINLRRGLCSMAAVQAENQAIYSASSPTIQRPQEEQSETFDYCPARVAFQVRHVDDKPAEAATRNAQREAGLWEGTGQNPANEATLLRNERNSLQELCSHEVFLTTLNWELVKAIQDMEDSSALNARAMLQQQDILATIVDILECSNKKKLRQLTCELKEWEEKEESKMKHLEQQVEQLNATIEKTQKEVNFLSTYMDREYPVKSVQIANLVRQLQQIKDSQQDELDDLNEMRRKVLESLSEQIQRKKKKLLRSLVVKNQQRHQEALLQKIRDGQDMLRCTGKLREWPSLPAPVKSHYQFISQFEEEIPILKAEVGRLKVQVQEPRETVFADVLLRRPKCPPDMDVILNIPVEELLPF